MTYRSTSPYRATAIDANDESTAIRRLANHPETEEALVPFISARMFKPIFILVFATACSTPAPKQQPSPNDAGTDGPPEPAGCVKHEDCASSVCLPNSSCADPARVAYVDPTGTDNSSCTQAMPCVSLQKALATPQPNIKMTGTTKENVKISDDVTVFADPDAKLASASAGSVVEIAGSIQVSIFDLEITGAIGPVGHGILVQPGKATVALERVALTQNALAGLYVGAGNTATISKSTVDGNAAGVYVEEGILYVNQTTLSGSAAAGLAVAKRGIATATDSTLRDNHDDGGEVYDGGTLNVVHSTIKDNKGWGLIAYGSTLNVKLSTIQGNNLEPGAGGGAPGISAVESAVTVAQSTIVGNASGGISVYRPTEFHIANNFIVRNGTTSSSVGGVVVHRDPGSPNITGELRFNTVADNQVQGSSVTSTGGISCDGGFAAPSNLIVRNSGGDGNPPTLGDCNFTGSVVNPPYDPAFKSAMDYHLTASTPATIIDQATCAGNDRDIDDDRRPYGAACDTGADEYRP